MAVGKKSSRLKLKVDTRAKLNMEEEQSQNIIENTSMASAPDQSPLSHMESVSGPVLPFDYTDLDPVPSQQPMSRTSASLAAARRRKSTKGSVMSALKRSASTPSVRGLIAGEDGMSLADKRRNKLGYHRTSVACGESYPWQDHERDLPGA